MTAGIRLQKRKLVLIGTVLFLIISSTPANIFSASSELFPLPPSLKTNVEFWTKVYTLYNSNQVIIHDAEILEVIYEIFDVTELFPGDSVSEKLKWKEVEKIKKKYQNILLKLAKQQKVDPELLDVQERYVYNLFKSDPKPSVFRRAARNIRGQQGLRDHFRQGLIRSGRYIEQMKKIFKKHNLPLELLALPHVESSFNYNAYSKFGAAGIWQFTRHTGRRFLKINYTLDERFDPIKSTLAAAKLLKENYQELRSWPLAITAYNHGFYGMKRAVARLKTRDIGIIVKKYKSRSFKFASRNFYAEFLAALEVSNNYKIHFGELEFEEPVKYQIFKVPGYIKVSTLAERLGVTVDEIKEYNPSLRRSVLQSRRRLPKGFSLKIPHREGFDPVAAYARIPKKEMFQNQLSTNWYQVEMGDNLHSIARQFNTSVAELMRLNDIINPNQIYAGEVLKIRPEEALAEAQPANTSASQKSEITMFAQANKQLISEERTVDAGGEGADISGPHISGRTLSAENYQKVMNDIVAREKVVNQSYSSFTVEESETGQDLKATYGTITVRPEETLGHYADWLKIPTQELRELNGLRFGQDIQVAQKVKLLFRNVSEKQFKQKRMEFHRAIEEDFFSSFWIDRIKIHKVRQGDKIWDLCNDVYDIPYWLVLKYNPNKDLHNLQAGDLLVIPNVVPVNNSQSE